MHVFSNGGSLGFVDVCTLYRKATGTILCVEAVVLDSAPGLPRLKEGWIAMSLSLPKGMAWYPGAVVILFMLALGWVQGFFGGKSIVEEMRGWLNDAEIVDRGAKRLYVYSEEDRLVGWRDVESHAMEAEGKGVVVRRLRFEGTPHVQHVIREEERYWRAVVELWESRRG